MFGFETDERISFIQKEVDRFRGDVEDWKSRHDELAQRCWFCENMIAMGNFVFGRIMRLDMDIQKHVFNSAKINDPVEPELLNSARKQAAAWLESALSVQKDAEQLLKEYGAVDGYQEMKSNIEDARAFLTPDHEFFDSDELADARDKAIDDYRAGLSEPLLSNGHSTE